MKDSLFREQRKASLVLKTRTLQELALIGPPPSRPFYICPDVGREIEIKVKVKGNGQECPFHTSEVKPPAQLPSSKNNFFSCRRLMQIRMWSKFLSSKRCWTRPASMSAN